MITYAWTISNLAVKAPRTGPSGRDARQSAGSEPNRFNPPDFDTLNPKVPGGGTYTHSEGGIEEWSVRWTRIDSQNAAID
jgi:hypothetical protein